MTVEVKRNKFLVGRLLMRLSITLSGMRVASAQRRLQRGTRHLAQAKPLSSDADNCERVAFDADLLSDYIRDAAEVPLPEFIADHSNLER